MLTKETVIGDILELDCAEDVIPLFQAIGMHCLGCAAASDETIEEACMVHGVDSDAFIAAVNAVIDQVSQ